MKCREAERALRNLGFEEEPSTGGSHRKFRKLDNGTLYKVTLDCHRGEVKAKDVRSMIKQAGVTKQAWYQAASR